MFLWDCVTGHESTQTSSDVVPRELKHHHFMTTFRSEGAVRCPPGSKSRQGAVELLQNLCSRQTIEHARDVDKGHGLTGRVVVHQHLQEQIPWGAVGSQDLWVAAGTASSCGACVVVCFDKVVRVAESF